MKPLRDDTTGMNIHSHGAETNFAPVGTRKEMKMGFGMLNVRKTWCLKHQATRKHEQKQSSLLTPAGLSTFLLAQGLPLDHTQCPQLPLMTAECRDTSETEAVPSSVTEEAHLNSLVHTEAKVLLPIYSQMG